MLDRFLSRFIYIITTPFNKVLYVPIVFLGIKYFINAVNGNIINNNWVGTSRMLARERVIYSWAEEVYMEGRIYLYGSREAKFIDNRADNFNY